MKGSKRPAQKRGFPSAHLAGKNCESFPRRDAVLKTGESFARVGHHVKKSRVGACSEGADLEFEEIVVHGR